MNRAGPAGRRAARAIAAVAVGLLLALNGAAGLSIQEGESAIFRPDGAGSSRLLARVTAERWQAL